MPGNPAEAHTAPGRPRCSTCANAHAGAVSIDKKVCEDCNLKRPSFGLVWGSAPGRIPPRADAARRRLLRRRAAGGAGREQRRDQHAVVHALVQRLRQEPRGRRYAPLLGGGAVIEAAWPARERSARGMGLRRLPHGHGFQTPCDRVACALTPRRRPRRPEEDVRHAGRAAGDPQPLHRPRKNGPPLPRPHTAAPMPTLLSVTHPPVVNHPSLFARKISVATGPCTRIARRNSHHPAEPPRVSQLSARPRAQVEGPAPVSAPAAAALPLGAARQAVHVAFAPRGTGRPVDRSHAVVAG